MAESLIRIDNLVFNNPGKPALKGVLVDIVPDAETCGQLLRHLLDAELAVVEFTEDQARMHDIYLASMRRNGGEGV